MTTQPFAERMWEAWDADRANRHNTPPTNTDTINITDPAKYATSALERACNEFGNTGAANQNEGAGRNQALNTAAFTLGRLVSARLLDEHTVQRALLDACQRNGLLQWTGQYACEATINSGLSAGKAQPLAWTHTPLGAPAGVATFLTADSTAPEDGNSQPPTPDEIHALRVTSELLNLRARDEARNILDQEKAAREFRIPPSRWSVREELELPDDEVTYAVDKVLPTGTNALLTAAYKTGKSTTIGDLAAAHADGGRFLDKFDVTPSPGRLAIFNYELSDGMYRRWLRELNVENPDRLAVLHLRGFRMPVIVRSVEDWVVQWLQEREVTRWVVDPFARAFTGCGDENDNGHVGRFLDTLDIIKERAGVSELVLPTHTGRMVHEQGQERARGATRLDDWADVRWMLNADDEGTRYFSATGRDVDEAEESLVYDEARRRYRKEGHDRRGAKTISVEKRVLAAIEQHPGIGSVALREAVRKDGPASNDVIAGAVERLKAGRKVRVEEVGKNRLHHPGGPIPFIYEPPE